ncbi:MAG: hypothetical protein K2I03_12240 [Lachnospiraceae bacterium]|nr:hypothetical protein [Lachnospiraceae bacterium]MDE6252400.1 hypothetical protein [Lachnospiraceae bacterium]
MRKMMKKVILGAATMAMSVAMGCVAFAGDGSTYKVVGAEGLVGESWVEAAQTDDTSAGAPGEKGLMAEVEGMDNVYSVTLNIATADDGEGDTKYEGIDLPIGYEFKILKDADDFAWTYQCGAGHPSVAWADNQTQFKLPADTTGEVTIYVDATTGAVAVVDAEKNAIPYLVRWQSKDEHPYAFTAPIKSAIEAAPENATTGWKFENVPDIEGANEKLYKALEVTAPTYDDAESSNGGDEDSTGAEKVTDGDEKETKDSAETTKPAADEEEESSNTGVIVVVIIVVVVVIAAVAIVLSKKKK